MIPVNNTDEIASNSTLTHKHIEKNIFIFFSIITTLFIFCGNCLVVAAVATTKRLQTVTNMYVVSLAVADLLVAILVLPPSIGFVYTDKWVFDSEISCIAWLSADILLCTASIYNLVVISIDRYMAVTSPLKYIAQRTKTRAIVMIVFAWAFSFFLVLPPLLGLKEHKSNNGTCEITNDKLFRFISASSTFYIPFVIMIYLYTRIFIVSYRRLTMMKKNFPDLVVATSTSNGIYNANNKFNNSSLTSSSSLNQIEYESQQLDEKIRQKHDMIYQNKSRFIFIHKFLLCPQFLRRKPSLNEDSGKIIRVTHKKANKHLKYHRKRETFSNSRKGNAPFTIQENINFLEEPEPVSQTKLYNMKHFILDYENVDSSESSSLCRSPIKSGGNINLASIPPAKSKLESGNFFREFQSNSTSTSNQKTGILKDEKSKERAAFQRENKTAITLAYVIGCFTLCWFPFFICYIAEPYISGEFPKLLITGITWLGYINSVFNPFIYAFYNKEYANAFRKFLRF